jgi:hypothetical protein
MPKFRQKPVVIDAFQWRGDISALLAWDREHGPSGVQFGLGAVFGLGAGISMPTLEGEMHGQGGDWIIKGVKGEFYLCKPDIFAATYEPVDTP